MNNDLISRSQLYNLESLLMTDIVVNNPTAKFVLEQVLYDIDNIEAIGLDEVAHGRWLYDSGSGRYFCSDCNEYALSFKKDTLYGGDLYEVCLTDYCPNCGARMMD